MGEPIKRDTAALEIAAIAGAEIAAAEARTWRRAVEALRDRTRWSLWLADHFDRHTSSEPDREPWPVNEVAADYLESLSGQTPARLLPTPPSAGNNETGKTDG